MDREAHSPFEMCHIFLTSSKICSFRDGKSTDEEIKAWQFWHQRQHSVNKFSSYPHDSLVVECIMVI